MKVKGKGPHFLLLSWMENPFHGHHFEGGLGPEEKSRGKEVFVWGGVRALERLAVQVFLSQLIVQFLDEEKIIRALQQCVTIYSSLITRVINILITIFIVIILTQLCVHWGCKVTCVAPLYTHQV